MRKNGILKLVIDNDQYRYRMRVVQAEKGKGRKNRPRKKNWITTSYDRAA